MNTTTVKINRLIRKAIETRKGVNVTLCWKRRLKTKKSCQAVIEKEVCSSGRLGINYENQKIVGEKRKSGELPSENQGLPWGRWKKFPYLIEHNGQKYLRLYRNSAGHLGSVSYFRNGVEVDYAEIEGEILASEKPKQERGDCFNVKLENMVSID